MPGFADADRPGFAFNSPEEGRAAEVTLEVIKTVSYTHLRAHETVLDIVCRLLLEKKHHNDTHAMKLTHATQSINLIHTYNCHTI